MKLKEIKKLGVELSKEELKYVSGGIRIRVHYGCADGMTGTAITEQGNYGPIEDACANHGGMAYATLGDIVLPSLP
jgi:hypothetical protein